MHTPDVEWRQHLAAGRFMLQRAPGGSFVFPPRVAAPRSGEQLEWVEASGRGRIYSTVVVRTKPPAIPYNVALVDLDENVRMMSRVEGIEPGAVTIGLAVRARIADEDGKLLVVFEPAE